MNVPTHRVEIVGQDIPNEYRAPLVPEVTHTDIPSETQKVTTPVKELTIYESATTATPEHQKILIELIEEYKQPVGQKAQKEGFNFMPLLIVGGAIATAYAIFKG